MPNFSSCRIIGIIRTELDAIAERVEEDVPSPFSIQLFLVLALHKPTGIRLVMAHFLVVVLRFMVRVEYIYMCVYIYIPWRFAYPSSNSRECQD